MEGKPNLFLRFIYALLRSLHLYTSKQHDEVCRTINQLNDAKVSMLNEQLDFAENKANRLAEENGRLMSMVEETTSTVSMLEEENGKLRTSVEEFELAIADLRTRFELANRADEDNMKLVKETQKALSEGLHGTTMYEFRGSHPIPGSTSVQRDTFVDGNDECTVVRMRCLALDETTTKINDMKTNAERIRAVVDQMRRYGTFGRIAEELLRSGAMAMTLAYNGNNTTYELYVETMAKNYNDKTTFVIVDPETADHKEIADSVVKQ